MRFLKSDMFNCDIIGICSYETTKKDNKEVVLDYRIYIYKSDDKFKVSVYYTGSNEPNIFEFDDFGTARDFADNIYI